jgi:FKBP-type peptidyl-prolyl cis-trans isomerase
MNQFVVRALASVLSCGLVSIAIAQTTAPSPAAKPAAAPAAKGAAPMAGDRKTVYEMGVLMSGSLQGMSMSDAEFNTLKQGITDGFHGKASSKDADASITDVQAFVRDRVQKQGQAYLAKAAKTPGAVTTPSGIVYLKVKEGIGPKPARSDKVKVTYEGRLTDGTVFDSSVNHGGSATFPLTGVIPCWTEAVQMMKVGGKSRVVCPSDLAYRERGAPPRIKPNSTLEFDIELLEIETPTPPAAVPEISGSSSGAAAK